MSTTPFAIGVFRFIRMRPESFPTGLIEGGSAKAAETEIIMNRESTPIIFITPLFALSTSVQLFPGSRHNQLAVFHALHTDQFIGNMLDRLHFAPDYEHLKTVVRIKMHVER